MADRKRSILVLGAGPIRIGQAAEFDYSGTQALRALKAEGHRTILVNSNPASIMTDPMLADATYVEPLTLEIVEKIIEIEKPDSLLPTVGGQTALNLAIELDAAGVLERHGVELLGAQVASIELAEDRRAFQRAMREAGVPVPDGGMASTLDEGLAIARRIDAYPLLIRASFTLGGAGAAFVESEQELTIKLRQALDESPAGTAMIERCLSGWKEFELEVMCDSAGRYVVVCCIENLDAMGVHTGDSITVAPAMTLTDREYQRLRDLGRKVMAAVGVSTGGANVQFAVDPSSGEVLVIEMNPRVSRSSALASKATGFPIARLAALVALGHRLDDLPNEVTGTTVAGFEPTLDYVVVKLPRFAFEKFAGADHRLGPLMRSVGETMAIGRTFSEAFLKGVASLELGGDPWPKPSAPVFHGDLTELEAPTSERFFAIWEALRADHGIEAVAKACSWDVWYIAELAEVVAVEREIATAPSPFLTVDLLRRAKRLGFSDAHIAHLLESPEIFGAPVRNTPIPKVAELRKAAGLEPSYHVVDTCAAEFASQTPYLYGSWESTSEMPPSEREKVIILGGGPNRIGQGIEFDCCAVEAAFAVKDEGYEAVMVNCNPETVSTDYDTSDRLYFEPITAESVINIARREQPLKGIIAQFGGQTPLNILHRLEDAGLPTLGTGSQAIDRAEDRDRFLELMAELAIPVPPGDCAGSLAEAERIAERIGYPVLVRPSYVLGGRGMAIVYDRSHLDGYLEEALAAFPGQDVLIDRFLEDAYEVEVDAISDGKNVVCVGLMQHIEEAGVHSGDSAAVMPPYKISAYHLGQVRDYTSEIALALQVHGLINIQLALKDDVLQVLEVNPRASRTVPWVSRSTGVPIARLATRVALGRSLEEVGLDREPPYEGFFVKEAVMPWNRFAGVDSLLGPEMRSTGEVMGRGASFGMAFGKAQMAAGEPLPDEGTVFLSVNDFDKGAVLKIARDLSRLGFEIIGTTGTAEMCRRVGLPVATVNKVYEGSPHIVDLLSQGRIDLVVNTPLGPVAHEDGKALRAAAIRHKVPMLSTLSAAQAAVLAIRAHREGRLEVRSLQSLHGLN